jgi:BolA protein
MDTSATTAGPVATEIKPNPVATEIKQRLVAALAPTRLDLEDQSDRHIGHAGHDSRGESHFALVIESATFAGLNRVARQRAVYAALGELMDNRVHALTIRAVAPGER